MSYAPMERLVAAFELAQTSSFIRTNDL